MTYLTPLLLQHFSDLTHTRRVSGDLCVQAALPTRREWQA